MAARQDDFSDLQRVARRRGQRGFFTTAQAEGAGISRTRLGLLVKRGLVVRAAPGVYRFRVSAAETWKDRLAVELLSPGAVACGLSSVALYGFTDPPTQPSVIVRRGARTARGGRHTTRDLPRHEFATIEGLRVLTPTRALLDSAHLLPTAKAIAMVESAIVHGMVKPDVLARRAKELMHSKRPGCAVVLRILADLHPEVARSRNEWEALVARRAKEYGLAPPRLEYELLIDGRRYIADAAWPEQRVALEFDGRDPHMRRRVHDNDTDRRNDFADAGWKRFGITASALNLRDDRAFRQVARAIARRTVPGMHS